MLTLHTFMNIWSRVLAHGKCGGQQSRIRGKTKVFSSSPILHNHCCAGSTPATGLQRKIYSPPLIHFLVPQGKSCKEETAGAQIQHLGQGPLAQQTSQLSVKTGKWLNSLHPSSYDLLPSTLLQSLFTRGSILLGCIFSLLNWFLVC